MSSNNNNNNKVYFVTGTSNGIGLTLVQRLVKDGFKVAALTRRPEELEKQITEGDLNNLLIIKTDITNEQSVKESIEKTISKFNRIDVVVNNAGFGLLGTVEELTLDEVKSSYEVNVFAVISVIKNVLPYLRKQKSGLILNIGSYTGHVTNFPKYSAYIGSKHALTGISYSVDLEVQEFGVRSVLLSLGGFKTSFLKSGLQVTKNLIPEYKTQETADFFNTVAGKEPGNPDKLAQVIIDISNKELSNLPNNIHIGSDSYHVISKGLEEDLKNLESYKDITLSTDF